MKWLAFVVVSSSQAFPVLHGNDVFPIEGSRHSSTACLPQDFKHVSRAEQAAALCMTFQIFPNLSNIPDHPTASIHGMTRYDLPFVRRFASSQHLPGDSSGLRHIPRISRVSTVAQPWQAHHGCCNGPE